MLFDNKQDRYETRNPTTRLGFYGAPGLSPQAVLHRSTLMASTFKQSRNGYINMLFDDMYGRHETRSPKTRRFGRGFCWAPGLSPRVVLHRSTRTVSTSSNPKTSPPSNTCSRSRESHTRGRLGAPPPTRRRKEEEEEGRRTPLCLWGRGCPRLQTRTTPRTPSPGRVRG